MLSESCAFCGGDNKFQVEDLPVGPRWFCTEKCYAEYAGLPVKESGYYGLEAESFMGESGQRETFDGGWSCGTCDKMFHSHNDAEYGGCSKDKRYFNEGIGEYCGCNKEAEDRAEYCCMGAESFEANSNNIIVTDKYTHKKMALVGETANGTPIWKNVTSTGKIPKNARRYTMNFLGAGWYARLLKGERHSRHETPPKRTEHELMEEIYHNHTMWEYGPENLWEDGEASLSRVKEKLATSRRKIKIAEKELGRKVSQAQAIEWAKKNTNFENYGAESFEAEYAPSVEGMIDNPAGYYSYWQSFCEYIGVNDAHMAWRMVEKPWKWRTELEEWVKDPEWFSQEAESFEADYVRPKIEEVCDTLGFEYYTMYHTETGFKNVHHKSCKHWDMAEANTNYGRTWEVSSPIESIQDELLSHIHNSDGGTGEMAERMKEKGVKTLRDAIKIQNKHGGIKFDFAPCFKKTDKYPAILDEPFDVEKYYEAESKKINPLEKAGLTGVASGATMEGLELALAAETKCSLKGMFHINYHNFYQKAKDEAYVRNEIDGEVTLNLSYGKASERQIENYIQNALTDLKWIMKECESTGNYGGGRFSFRFWKLEDCEAFATQFPKYCRVKINSSPIDNKNKYPDTASCSESVEKHGEASCEFEVEYRPDRDGKGNETGMKRLNKVCSVLGIEDREYIPKEYVHQMNAESFSAEEITQELYDFETKDFAPEDSWYCEGCSHTFKVGDSYAIDGDLFFCATCSKDFKTCDDCDETYDPEGEHKWAKTCSYCRGDGFILTSYTSASYDDPAEGDGHDCGYCDGLGYVCEGGDGYGAESAEDKSCECGREGSTKFCEGCRYDKCEKCFEEMGVECRHCDGQDKTPDGKWCEYCDGGEKYICHEATIPEFDWAVMEPEERPYSKEDFRGLSAEETKSLWKQYPIVTGVGIAGLSSLIYSWLKRS